MKLSRAGLIAAVIVSIVGCVQRSNEPAEPAPEETGQIQLRLVQAPPEVQCVRLTVRGARVAERLFAASTPGTSTLLLEGMPLGPVTVKSEAFSQVCGNILGAVALWVTEPISANIKVSPPVEIDLLFHRNGRAEVVLTFQDEPDGGIAPEPPVFFNSITMLATGNVFEYRAGVGPPAPPTEGNVILAATAVAPLPTDDACNPLPPGSLTGRAALVRRGTCTFVQKTQNVAAAGAVAIVVDDHTDEILVTGSVPGVSIPFIFITKASGEQIRGAGLPALMQWNGVATVVR